jgi:hypothetical protein
MSWTNTAPINLAAIDSLINSSTSEINSNIGAQNEIQENTYNQVAPLNFTSPNLLNVFVKGGTSGVFAADVLNALAASYLESGSIGALLSTVEGATLASAIAGAVLNALAASYDTADTIGAAINSGGGGGSTPAQNWAYILSDGNTAGFDLAGAFAKLLALNPSAIINQPAVFNAGVINYYLTYDFTSQSGQLANIPRSGLVVGLADTCTLESLPNTVLLDGTVATTDTPGSYIFSFPATAAQIALLPQRATNCAVRCVGPEGSQVLCCLAVLVVNV